MMRAELSPNTTCAGEMKQWRAPKSLVNGLTTAELEAAIARGEADIERAYCEGLLSRPDQPSSVAQTASIDGVGSELSLPEPMPGELQKPAKLDTASVSQYRDLTSILATKALLRARYEELNRRRYDNNPSLVADRPDIATVTYVVAATPSDALPIEGATYEVVNADEVFDQMACDKPHGVRCVTRSGTVYYQQ